MLNALRFSHQCLQQLLDTFPQGHFIDATLGNGHDIYSIVTHDGFLGKAYGFDIQQIALENTRQRLSEVETNRYTLYKMGHEHIRSVLQDIPTFSGAIFNLGYLPGGDHQITTLFVNTQAAIEAISEKLEIGAQIILVLYSGHPQGKIEKNQLLKYLESWPQKKFQILHYQFINQENNPPSCIIIERLKD